MWLLNNKISTHQTGINHIYDMIIPILQQQNAHRQKIIGRLWILAAIDITLYLNSFNKFGAQRQQTFFLKP